MKLTIKEVLNLKPLILLETIFFPFLAIWRMPISWIYTIWNARVFLKKSPENYMSYVPMHATNAFFYRTQLLNLMTYGRNGQSPIVGLGKYKLNQWFHISIISSYLYSKAGALVMLIGTIIWSFSNLIWLADDNYLWVSIITISLIISSTSFCMAFRIQNYQILGWFLLPAALFLSTEGSLQQQLIIWFLISFLNITVTVFSIPIIFYLSVENITLLYVFLPIAINFFIRVFPLLKEKNLLATFTNISKMLGASAEKPKYIRKSKSLSIKNIYYITLYSIPIIYFFFFEINIYMLLIAWLLVVINQVLIRFADDQSPIIFYITILTYNVNMIEPGLLNWLIFWIVVNPVPIMLWLDSKLKGLNPAEVEIRKPFDHSIMVKDWKIFFTQ